MFACPKCGSRNFMVTESITYTCYAEDLIPGVYAQPIRGKMRSNEYEAVNCKECGHDMTEQFDNAEQASEIKVCLE